MSYASKVSDEASIMAQQSTKHSYFGIGFGHRKFQDGSYVFVAGADFFLRYMMCEVYYFGLEEGTFGGFQFEVKFAEALQYYSEPF